jgi:proteasome accessory factor C
MTRLTASERLQRLLSLIPWVAAGDGPTVKEICARFELGESDLLADLALVSMVGVPPYTPDELFDVVVEDDRVWVHLSPSFQRSLRLTPDQALALVASGASLLAVPGADPEGALARGLAKLAGTLGVDPDETVDVDLGNASAEVLATLRAGITERRSVKLDYYAHGRDEMTVRTIDPYRVYADQGQWYVVGHDHLREGERLFRVDRIVAAELLDATFEPPEEQRDLGLFEPGADDPRVTIELEPEAGWVLDSYPYEGAEQLGDGRLRVRLAISARPWLERLLLRLGPHAKVVEIDGDPTLGDAGTDAAQRLLTRYRAR